MTFDCACCGKTVKRKPHAIKIRLNPLCSRACYNLFRQASLPTRFWARVDKSAGEDSCWIWTGSCRGKGYGQIHTAIQGQGVRGKPAHVVSFFLANGKWPASFVCHTCDNPSCVNPRHLFDGSPKENSEDMARKGRAAKKLSQDAVHNIRRCLAEGLTTRQVAKTFGTSKSNVWAIGQKETWAWLPDVTPGSPNTGNNRA